MNVAVSHADLRAESAGEIRRAIRSGAYSRHTAGLAPGKLQVNLAILPEDLALDFFRFCQRNPRPCPLVGVGDTGDPVLRTLGRDLDVRTDAPAYNIYRDGELAETRSDIGDLWRDDLVAFALGCSFTFERALAAEGVPLRHVELDRTVPMFRSAIECERAGPFGGGMVVSMRPVPRGRLEQVEAICRRFPHAHGAPVHHGDPSAIGIGDTGQPDWGEAVPVESGEVPVFWACGVTPQSAIRAARPPLFISHRPGAMLITDVDDDADPPVLNARRP